MRFDINGTICLYLFVTPFPPHNRTQVLISKQIVWSLVCNFLSGLFSSMSVWNLFPTWNMNSKKSNAFTVSPFAKSDWFYSPPARWGSSYLKEPVYTNTLAPTDALGVFGDLYAWLVGLMCPLCRCLGTYSPQMSHVSWCFIIHFFMLFLVFFGGITPLSAMRTPLIIVKLHGLFYSVHQRKCITTVLDANSKHVFLPVWYLHVCLVLLFFGFGHCMFSRKYVDFFYLAYSFLRVHIIYCINLSIL